MGARPLNRKIDELIRVPLSKRILFDQLTDCTLNVVLDGDRIEFETAVKTEISVPLPV
jgi:ATP-dependent Clp protease ATP-binding subunit ClpA